MGAVSDYRARKGDELVEPLFAGLGVETEAADAPEGPDGAQELEAQPAKRPWAIVVLVLVALGIIWLLFHFTG